MQIVETNADKFLSGYSQKIIFHFLFPTLYSLDTTAANSFICICLEQWNSLLNILLPLDFVVLDLLFSVFPSLTNILPNHQPVRNSCMTMTTLQDSA